MMPPPHINNKNRNRVENIKKKFEDINNFVPVADNLNNCRPNLAHKSRLGRSQEPENGEPKCLSDSPKKQKLASNEEHGTDEPDFHNINEASVRTSSGTHPLLERQLSSPTSRGHIKRSPAFRCDRIVKGRNVINPSICSVAERPKSVVDKRVKQFDSSSPSDLVSAKPCNAVLAEQRIPGSDRQLSPNQNNVSERARAYTSPPRFDRPSKLHFGTENGGPVEAKRNRLDFHKSPNCLKNTNAVNQVGGWLHKQGREFHGSSADLSNGLSSGSNLSPSESVPLKNLLSEVKLKKVSKDVSGNSSGFYKYSQSGGNQEVHGIVRHTSPVSAQQNCVFGLSVLSGSKEEERLTKNQGQDTSSVYQPGLSATLKAALKAPLPIGPPPKKPPRTFAHGSPAPSITPRTQIKNGAISNSKPSSPSSATVSPPAQIVKPVRSKTESQIMLRKLENALLNHKAGDKHNSTIPANEKEHSNSRQHCKSPSENNSSKPSESLTTPHAQRNVVSPASAIRSGCLSSLNCVVGPSVQAPSRDSIYEQRNVLESGQDPITKRKSSLQDAESGYRLKLESTLHKSHSEEHIYAEPFQFIGDSTRICTSKNCEANFRPPLVSREETKVKFHPKRILSTSPEQGRGPDILDTTPEGLHYLCTPIQENTEVPLGELHMTSLPGSLHLSAPPVEATNSEILRKASRECLSLESAQTRCGVTSATPGPKTALKRSSGDKTDKVDKTFKDCTDSNLNSTKIKFLMNQAFGSPLQCLPATTMDSNSDSDSVASTPDEGVSLAPFPGVPSPPSQPQHKEIIRPTCPPPDVPETPPKDSLQQLTVERRIYVRRVSSHVTSRTSLRLAPTQSSPNHLFECLVLVGLNLDPNRPKCKVPYIKSKFPPEAEVPPHMEDLCFPDAGEWPPPIHIRSPTDLPGEEQCYSFVITNDSGERKYGYCRRVQPEGAPICLPLAYCILTPFRASGFYFKVLAELESRHGEPEIQQAEFIQYLYESSLPSPGQGLSVNSCGQQLSVGCTGTSSTNSSGSSSVGSGGGRNVVFKRHYDSRLEERDLSRLFNALQIPVFLQVFSSLLLERKVLLLSSSISKLSSCVDALQSILFPFVWQHTFIPVLPTNMLDICQAPTPFIIGVLKGRHPVIPPVTIDDGIVVDVDSSVILQSQQDETTILPSGISRSLRVALQLVQSSTSPHETSRNVLVSEAFLRLFVEVCGHYQNHIVVQQDGRRVFERESFIKASRSRTIQLFLEWFTETAMFSAFIESRIRKPEESKGMFEQRAAEHHDEREKNTLLYLKNYKGINKKVKTLGDRFKDWTPFS